MDDRSLGEQCTHNGHCDERTYHIQKPHHHRPPKAGKVGFATIFASLVVITRLVQWSDSKYLLEYPWDDDYGKVYDEEDERPLAVAQGSGVFVFFVAGFLTLYQLRILGSQA